MIEILTLCTGNICRSPLAAQLLRRALGDVRVRVESAGTHARDRDAMAPDAVRLAERLGVGPDEIRMHRARRLDEGQLTRPDLILTMDRDQRRAVVEIAPTRVHATFTVREFARLARAVPREELQAAASAGESPSGRVRAMARELALHRGLVPQPVDPEEDDVPDPYGREWHAYVACGAQLVPAIRVAAETVRGAVTV